MTDAPLSRSDVLKALTQTVGYPFLSSKEIVDAVFPLLDAAAARVPELERERDEAHAAAARMNVKCDDALAEIERLQQEAIGLKVSRDEWRDFHLSDKAEIERLRGRDESWVAHSKSQDREIQALRARLAAAPDPMADLAEEYRKGWQAGHADASAAAPDLTELRPEMEKAVHEGDYYTSHDIVCRLLAAVPSTDTDFNHMCPHCGKRFGPGESPTDPSRLVPTHDYPAHTRQVCPGSGQKPRNALTDHRPLRNGKLNPHVDIKAADPDFHYADHGVAGGWPHPASACKPTNQGDKS